MFRKANLQDLDDIFTMSHGEWGEGRELSYHIDYCKSAPKYKLGTWYVLDVESKIVSSAIVYQNCFNLPENSVGIGSISTYVQHRRRGHGETLIRGLIDFYRNENITAIYLHSEISPEYYRKFGFEELRPQLQKYKDSICMVKILQQESKINLDKPDIIPTCPNYF